MSGGLHGERFFTTLRFVQDDRRGAGELLPKRFRNGIPFFANAVVMQTQREVRAMTGERVRDKEAPELIVNGGASYLVHDWELAVFAQHVSRYENERFLPGGSTPKGLGDFTEVNAKVSYLFGKKQQHRAFIGVDNITDDRYSTVIGYPDEGITFKTGFSLSF